MIAQIAACNTIVFRPQSYEISCLNTERAVCKPDLDIISQIYGSGPCRFCWQLIYIQQKHAQFPFNLHNWLMAKAKIENLSSQM